MVTTHERAPDLPDDLEWYNTDGAVSLESQRGKVVLLHFWSYSQIGCLQSLATLRVLEKRYAEDLTIIGIHSAKFPHEREGPSVQKAINRHHVRHPVANDSRGRVWHLYGAREWPTYGLISPAGKFVGNITGTERGRQLDLLIQHQLRQADRAGQRRPRRLQTRARPESGGLLRFPTCVLAGRNRLYISDTGQNRILEVTPDGRLTRTFGSGAPGFTDASGEEAAFNDPTGLALLDDESLFVADRGNHTLRRINLISREVETVAGTGRPGAPGAGAGHPLQVALNAPWDVTVHQGAVYVAVAGLQQVWRLNLRKGLLEPFVGSGSRTLFDGPPPLAAFGQPMGLVADYQTLYVADADASAVRAVRLPDGRVRTLIGQGCYEFGDVEGNATTAKLQYPRDIAADEARNLLWIADSFNNKIKKLDMRSHVVSSLPLDHALNEPSALDVKDDRLWIANTNAHEILSVAVDTGACTPLSIHE